MTITYHDFAKRHDNSAVHSNLDGLSVSTGERAIICVGIQDYVPYGITSIDVHHDTLINQMTMTRVFQHSRSVAGGGILHTQVWVSSKNTGFGGNQNFDIDIYPGTANSRIVSLGMSVGGLNTDDLNVFVTSATKSDTNNAFDTTAIGATPIPPSLLVAFFVWNERDNDPIIAPTNGFIWLGQEDTGANPIESNAYGYLAYKITDEQGLNCITGVGNPADYTAVMAAFAGSLQYEDNHTTDSFVRLVSEIDHDTDTLLRKTSTKQHTADSLLVGASSVFQSVDTYLKKTSEAQHSADMFIKPPSRPPILRDLLIQNVPGGANVGQYPVKILGIHGNAEAIKRFTYVLPPQEFIIGKSLTAQLDIVDSIVKKKYESTALEEELEPVAEIPLDNLEFSGFPSYFEPSVFPYEEFVSGWKDYAKMSDDPVEEGFEEPPVYWNDLTGDGWTKNRIYPEENLDPSYLEYGTGDNPTTPVKDVEDFSDWYPPHPVSLVQSVGASHIAGGSSSIPITFGVTPTPGNILILAGSSIIRAITSIVQTGVTWVGNRDGSMEYWVGYDVDGTVTPSLTVNLAAGDYNAAFFVAEYTGLLSDVNVLDVNRGGYFSGSDVVVLSSGINGQQQQLWATVSAYYRNDTILLGWSNGWSLAGEQVGNPGDSSNGTKVQLWHRFHNGLDATSFFGQMSPTSAGDCRLRTFNTE